MKQNIAVLGLGLFGQSVARNLAMQGVEVIAIDLVMENVEKVMDVVEHAVQADFTKIDQLKLAGVPGCDAAVIATGEKLEVSILALMHLKALGIEHVIVKTKTPEYIEVLEKVGATRVVLPEVELGYKLARELTSPEVIDMMDLDASQQLIEFVAYDAWVGETLRSLDARKRHGTSVIAVKESGDSAFNVDVDPTREILNGDVFLAFVKRPDKG